MQADSDNPKPSASRAQSQPKSRPRTQPQEDTAAVATVSVGKQGRKRKRKYSRDLADVQRFERRATRALLRVTTSVDAGVREWRRATDRSARRRRDGAIRDAPDNLARAVGVQIRVLSRAPEDVVSALRAFRLRRIVRRVFPIL